MAARILCADGTRWFVKAASAEVNPDTPRLHRQEARILAELDPVIAAGRLPVPRLRGTAELGPWLALIIDDVDGRQPELSWRDDQLSLVLASLDHLAAILTPSPIAVPGIEEYLGAAFTGWRTLAIGPAEDRIDPWSRARLGDLAALEATWTTHASGTTLVHGDIRADNLLLTGGGVMAVDWPHACRGASFTDLVLLAPSVAMQEVPSPPTCSRVLMLAAQPAWRTCGPSYARWPAISLRDHSPRRLPVCRRYASSRQPRQRSPAAGWRRCCDDLPGPTAPRAANQAGVRRPSVPRRGGGAGPGAAGPGPGTPCRACRHRCPAGRSRRSGREPRRAR